MPAPFELIVGPPASGKTRRALARARAAAEAGARVWWVGLPAQRAATYRRATDAGALLGLEFLTSQQLYYRLLAHARSLKPLVVGTGRLALMGEALARLRGELPSPGEARLFAYAVAEAKRYGLGPDDVRPVDDEGERFVRVFAAYERAKGARWDYDDFRREALALVRRATAPGRSGPDDDFEADLVVVDGFREVGPLELALYRALAERAGIPVLLTLPEAPPEGAGPEPSETLPPPDLPPPRAVRAANPVEEARWVLRSLKRDLAEGRDPLELAVIVPGDTRAFAALADEYGVPLMDETPKALADTRRGRLLLDLLELPDHPTASRLLAIPELHPLASAALERNVAGAEAIGALADELDLGARWRRWRDLLAPGASQRPDAGIDEHGGDEARGEERGATGGATGDESAEMAWARDLLDRALPELRGDPEASGGPLPPERFREHALQRAKEASSLARGESFRAWWSALLQETFLFDRPRGGVALLGPTQASGRRFAKVYLTGAVEGAYSAGEGEDYFVPEEARAALGAVFRNPGLRALPRRFQGRDRALHAELRRRGDVQLISYPDADQGGPRVPEPALIGAGAAPTDATDAPVAEPPPEVPAGSRLELPGARGYRADVQPVELGGATVETLRRYAVCAFRTWGERRVPDPDEPPWWRQLVGELRGWGKLNPARLDELRGRYPQAAAWLAAHERMLAGLTFGVRLPPSGDGPAAWLDAATRSGGAATLYRFVGPDRVATPDEAAELVNDRWSELWAAGYLLGRRSGEVTRVRIAVWPLLGEPVDAFAGAIDYRWRRIANRERDAEAAWARLQRGDAAPTPGFQCRSCRVFDLCREGRR